MTFTQGVKVAQSCLTLCNPMDYTIHGILLARSLSLLQGIFPTQRSNPGIVSHIAGGFLKRSFRILEWVAYPFFPTQESNGGLLHCRLILYQLIYQGSPLYIGLDNV